MREVQELRKAVSELASTVVALNGALKSMVAQQKIDERLKSKALIRELMQTRLDDGKDQPEVPAEATEGGEGAEGGEAEGDA